MHIMLKKRLLVVLMLLMPGLALTEETMVETFEFQPETRWRFFTDGVMGGVSTGQASFVTEDGAAHARMTGRVSTENNGGFIQIRMDLPDAPPQKTTGVRLLVRGNNQKYFIHLRTGGTMLPWQYYQAGFDVTRDWTEVVLPLSDFAPSGRLLRAVPNAGNIKSIGIVAYGRMHDADIEVREIGFY